jgi:nitrogen fixation/metabolism regulation signal transduction histidine kinase
MRPLVKVVATMQGIIRSGDLSHRVEVEYQDEIGELSHTFNLMIGELERAYKQIKSMHSKRFWLRRRNSGYGIFSRSMFPRN